MREVDIWFEEPPNFKNSGAIVKFFGRVGGASEGAYQSLNASYNVGDNPENVKRNRQIIANTLQVKVENLITVRQEHGTKIVYSTGPFANVPLADGIYTKNPSLALCILTADCIPLFVFDSSNKVLLAAHIGWRGALKRFLEIIIRKMKELNSNFKTLNLALGPSIKRCCYKVDVDFYEKFEKELGRDYEIEKYFLKVNDNLYFDLTELTLDQLERGGIAKDQIYVSPYCTHCRADLFFSYRRDGQRSGRQMSCGRILS